MNNLPAKPQHETSVAQRTKPSLIEMIEARRDEISKILPRGVTVDAFIRIVSNAVLKNPDIARADPTSVFLEVSKAAQDGLMLDGREAVLNVYNTKRKVFDERQGKEIEKWVPTAQYLPMVLGIRKRALQSGQVKALYAGIVYAKEVDEGKFRYLPLADEPVYHEPILFGERGDMVAAYSIAKLKDGTISAEVMRADEIEAIRQRSRSKGHGPWVTDYAEMAKKTVFRRHSKSLPLGSEFRAVFERIDAEYDFEALPDTQPAPRKISVAQRLVDLVASQDVQIDIETGEVALASVDATEPLRVETDKGKEKEKPARPVKQQTPQADQGSPADSREAAGEREFAPITDDDIF